MNLPYINQSPEIVIVLERHRHSVDMGDVIVPHLGIHLPLDEYQRVKASVASSVGFIDKPYIRFEDTDYHTRNLSSLKKI